MSDRSRHLVRVIGPVGLVRPDGSEVHLAPAHKRALALLVSAGPGGMHRPAFIDQFYGEQSDVEPVSATRGMLSKLRSSVPDGLLSDDHGRLGIDPTVVDVDLWLLRTVVDDPDRFTVSQLRGFLRGRPFDNIEDQLPHAPAMRDVEDGRAVVLDVLRRRHLASLTPGDLRTVADDVRRGEPHEGVVAAVVRLLTAAGDRTGAVDLLDHHLRLVDAVSPSAAPKRLIDLRREVEDAATASPTTLGALAPELGIRRVEQLLGRDAEVRRLVTGLREQTAVVAISGEDGSGKTAVAAEVAYRLGVDGVDSHYVAATGPSEQPFGAFVNCLGPNGIDLLDLLTDREFTPASPYAIWRRVHDWLTAGRGPSLIVFDDVAFYDDQSVQLAEFLCRSARPGQLMALVVAPRGHRLLGVAAAVEPLTGLTSDQVDELVGRALPHTTSLGRKHLVADLLTASQGRPDDVHRLLATVDPDHLELGVDHAVPGSATGLWAGLEPEAVEVAGALAVLGDGAGVDRIATVLRVSVVEVERALDRLVRARLVVGGIPRYPERLASERLRRAVLVALEPEMSHRLHFAALPHERDDVHRHAWHMEALAGMVGVQAAAEAMVTSARRHLAEGNPRRATDAFRRAMLLDASVLDVAATTDYATAVDLTGGRAHPLRTQAFSRALADDDGPAAARAALSGLPAAAQAEGDDERLALLQRLDEVELPPPEAFAVRSEVARQLLFVGRPGDARRSADAAAAVAVDDDERAQAWVVQRHVDGWRGADDAPRLDHVQASTAARVRQAQLSAALAQGTMAEVRRAVVDLESAAPPDGDPLRHWYALALGAAALEESGDWSAASARSVEAVDYGLRWGVSIAAATHAAQLAGRALLTGRPPAAAGAPHQQPSDVADAPLAKAVIARLLHAGGQNDIAVVRGRLLLDESVGSRFRAPMIAVLAPILAEELPASELEALGTELEPLVGGRIIVGAGIASLGPTARTLALLATGRQRVRLLRQAVDDADAYGSLPWRVVARLDLARATGERPLRLEAEALAGPGPLRRLVETEGPLPAPEEVGGRPGSK